MERPASSPAGTPRGTRRWFIPDLALSASLLTALFCILLFEGPRKLFRDSDTGWHIVTGERILDGAPLPRADPYSWTRGGEPWFAWEWGADLLMGAAHRAGGLTGVATLYALAIASVTWLWFRLGWRVGADFLLACALASPLLSTGNLHWLARPHVFGWVLLLIWLVWMERDGRPVRAPEAAAMAVFGALWANLHASFFLAPVIAGLYGAGALMRRAATGNPAAVGPYLWAAACVGVGSFCNPYGATLHLHLFEYLGNAELLKRVGEFQTFNFHSEGAAQILATVLICAAGATLAFTQGHVGRALVMALLLAVALRSARGLPVLALTLPFANAAIARALREARGLRPAFADALQYSANLRALDAGLRGYALVPLLVALTWLAASLPAMKRITGFPADQFPVEAAAAVERLPKDARLFAPDKFGGYLIWRFRGERKVFFDGRSDFYGTAFMKRYIAVVQVRPGWEKELAAWNPTHALLPLDYSLSPALEQRGWRRVHEDKTAVLLQAPALAQSP